jgi:hypothetical protein
MERRIEESVKETWQSKNDSGFFVPVLEVCTEDPDTFSGADLGRDPT